MMELVCLSILARIYITIGGVLFMYFTREAIVEFFVAKSFGEKYRAVWSATAIAFVGLIVFLLGIVQLVAEIVAS